MKKCFLFLFCFTLVFLFSSCEKNQPIDEIENYTITISPTEDGNLNMSYHIEWKVLNDKKEGPLEWVQIGVPNQYCFHSKANSDDIANISFHYNSNEGSYIRCDLTRPFYRNEVAILDFSFLQTHFFTIKDELVQFQFMPGWFDKIKVKHLAVYWSKDSVVYWNQDSKNVTTFENDDYYVWETALDFGETIEVNVAYEKSYFKELNENNANTMKQSIGRINNMMPFIFFGLFIFLFLLIILINYIKRDEYFAYRGFSGKRRFYSSFYHPSYHSSGKTISNPRVVNRGGHSGGGSSCACACACACAGGGRAGCSRKDFYDSSLSIQKLIEEIKKE